MVKRNPSAIISGLSIKDTKVIVKKPTIVHVPEIFRKKGLLVIESEVVETLGSMAVIQGDNYSFFNAAALFKSVPANVKIIDIGGIKYYELSYNTGDELISTNTVIKNGDLVQEMIYLYYFDGKIPYYMSYEDVSLALSTSSRYGGLGVDSAPEVLELMVALSARDPKDHEKLVRNTSDTATNWKYSSIDWVPLRNVRSTLGAFNKLVGTHQSVGITNSLITDTDNLTGAEYITRS